MIESESGPEPSALSWWANAAQALFWLFMTGGLFVTFFSLMVAMLFDPQWARLFPVGLVMILVSLLLSPAADWADSRSTLRETYLNL